MKADVKEKISAMREEANARNLPVMRERTAAFLSALIADKMPLQVLEIGTCTGVSGLTALAAGAQKLTTVELDSDRAEEARRNFAESGYGSNVTVIEGDCREVLRYLDGNKYDFVILDGPKSDLGEQFEECMGMLERGGIVFIDDVNYHGMIAAEGAPHKQRTIIRNMREFLDKLKTDERVKTSFYDEEDGFAVAEKIK
mgnify:CR=1 FL=1